MISVDNGKMKKNSNLKSRQTYSVGTLIIGVAKLGSGEVKARSWQVRTDSRHLETHGASGQKLRPK